MTHSSATPTGKPTAAILPTLPPASIELIELAASAHYGIRLRYVPEDQPESDPEPVKTLTAHDLEKAVAAGAKYGFGRETITKAWDGR
jgi:CBS domain-containing protein